MEPEWFSRGELTPHSVTSLYFPQRNTWGQSDRWNNVILSQHTINCNEHTCKYLHRSERGSAHFSLCRWVNSLIHSHEELGIEHVLDEATKLHQAVGLQVVQGDIVQRRDLHQKRKWLSFTILHICRICMLKGSQGYFTQVWASFSFSWFLKNSTAFASQPEFGLFWEAAKITTRAHL